MENFNRKLVKKEFTLFIQENNLLKLDQLLSDKSKLELLRNEKYLNPFVIAIRSKHLNLFNYLLEKGFVLIQGYKTKSNNQEKRVKKRFLNDSEDFSSSSESDGEKCSNYPNPLVEAVKCQNLEAINLLLSLKFDVNSTNYKYIPLQIAYNMHSIERDKFLLNQDFDFDSYQVRD